MQRSHHSLECKNKDKENALDSKKKDEDGVVNPPSKRSGGKNETINATHGTKTDGEYSSDDDFDDYGLLFATVETNIVIDCPNVINGLSKGELDLTKLEHAFGQNDSPIPNDWCILDNQSTVNVFRNGEYLKNIRRVEKYVVIKCNAGTRTTN